MNATTSSKTRLMVLATSTILILALVLLASFMSIAGAQPQEPPPLTEITLLDGPIAREIAPVDTNNMGPEWRPIFTENFEASNWVAKWDENLDLSNPKVNLKWGTQVIGNDLDGSSMKSGWSICADDSCNNVDPIAPSYPAGVYSVLIAGPFDFSRADDALIDLDLLYEANSGDLFRVLVSEDRSNFTPQLTIDQTIENGQWEERSIPLTQFTGDPEKTRLWIAFTFESANGAAKVGSMIDNVSIWTKGEAGVFMPYVAYGFTPTPIPVTPTATPQPGGGDFEQNFTNRIEPWEVRRWSNNTSYSIGHDDSSDGDYQGFLNLKVTKEDSYVIASPLVAGPSAPYNIESFIKLRSPRETDQQYGIIFGGNYTGGECPAPDFSTCFTQYYEMRVRFYYDELDDKDRMDIKLKRIDNHDGNNNNSGPDLIDWTRVSDIDENDFIEWDITVEANGKISISANDKPVKDATDSTYINNSYFGFIVRNGSDVEDAEVRFDYIKINSLD